MSKIIVIESVEALAKELTLALLNDITSPVEKTLLSCLRPIEVPSGVEELVRVLEDGFYNASNEFGDLQIEKYRTKAAALIESYSRRVPRAMLEEVANYARKQERNDAKGIDIGDIPFERIAAKYGVKVEG